jgi:hypothetical protein
MYVEDLCLELCHNYRHCTMAHGSATLLISLAVLFYAPHFHYHSLMVPHYMTISNCHNKELILKKHVCPLW